MSEKEKIMYEILDNNLTEWQDLLEELSEKEIRLAKCKDNYQNKSEEIIEKTDFKSIYGKNNADVRKNHVKKQLAKEHEEIKTLEFSIDYILRKISFIKEVVKTQRVLINIQVNNL